MSDELILVTGGSGYLGANVVKLLLEKGCKVRTTVRDSKNEAKVKHLRDLCPGSAQEVEVVEADLTKADTWPGAVKDCKYVIHVASPFPLSAPRHEDELIKPAVDGTLNVLRACAVARTVTRVVVTSSTASIVGRNPPTEDYVYTENDWRDVEDSSTEAYPKSKTLAERAAWRFVEELPEGEKFELSVVNPTLILGPVHSGSVSSSIDLLCKFLKREYPALPQFCLPICDVRDLSLALYKCMTLPEAAGHRHIIVSQSMWMTDIGAILAKEFNTQGYNIPTRSLPKLLVSFMSLFNGELRSGRQFEKVMNIDNGRMTNTLAIKSTKPEKTIIDMAYSLIEKGFVPKTSQYKGPPAC